ncbi:MAG: S1C family serine protease [Oscillospiraceae bacterium]|jgi:serine protease Do|nr:S1C family serine protease [Oscillospiraceae bacterium]
MKNRRTGWLAIVLALAMFAGGAYLYGANAAEETVVLSTDELAAQLSALPGVESPFANVYELVSQSVVTVNAVVQPQFSRGKIVNAPQSRLAGSGVVISSEGDTHYILTNQHVVASATGFSITANGQEYDATLVASDSNTDVAVLKVTDPAFNLPSVPIGNSDDIKVGEWVMVIGTPLDAGFANTLTVGVVSGLNREVSTRSGRSIITNKMIQIDAAINSGNSGGALFNTKGELIGIPSLKYTSGGYGTASVESIGMAIPINSAMEVVPDLIQYQQVVRPRIGVSISSTDSELDEPTANQLPAGIMVQGVEVGAPADIAGLKVYDIITEADGTRVRTVEELQKIVQSHQPGEIVKLKVYRLAGLSSADLTLDQGEYIDFDVTVTILDAVKQ